MSHERSKVSETIEKKQYININSGTFENSEFGEVWNATYSFSSSTINNKLSGIDSHF